MDTVPAESESRRPRKYLRLRLQAVIALVLIIGAGMGWLVRSAHIERDAVAAIQRVGGSVRYDWQWNNGKYLKTAQPWAPRWLVDFIGVDYFGHVTDVVVTIPPNEVDAIMAQLGSLIQLERLSLVNSPVGDVRLAKLKGLTRMVDLDLSSTRVTDDGFSQLVGMAELTSLGLRNLYVSDAGTERLKRVLPRVKIQR
jgi:hypothetical protein